MFQIQEKYLYGWDNMPKSLFKTFKEAEEDLKDFIESTSVYPPEDFRIVKLNTNGKIIKIMGDF